MMSAQDASVVPLGVMSHVIDSAKVLSTASVIVWRQMPNALGLKLIGRRSMALS
jgi:hypothetical protein